MSRTVLLPSEIQCYILRLCLQDWTARLENHTKPRNDDRNKLKSTLRIWSSKVYDALMISLTCKSFHAIVQHIQKDPRLFDGTIDLIEEPGALTYVHDIFRAQYVNDPNETPNVMYKTQVFIKDSRYTSSTKQGRAAKRRQYHADVRAWLMTHMRCLNIMWDEVAEGLDLSPFSQLRNLTLYWPTGSQYDQEDDLDETMWGPLCQVSICDTVPHERWVLNRMRSHIDDHFMVSTFEDLTRRGLTILHIWDVEHDHYGSDARYTSNELWRAHLRFEIIQTARNGHQIKSLACLQDYARPGQYTPMRFIEIDKTTASE